MTLFDKVKLTETTINGFYEPPRGTRPGAVALWKTLEGATLQSPLSLNEIVTEADFNRLFRFRMQEAVHDALDEAYVHSSMDFVKTLQGRLQARWFLLKESTGEDIGEIGLVPFTIGDVVVGRVQNVEIGLSNRGRGQGHKLMNALEACASNLRIQHLCLKARPEDWPIQWYQRMGYKEVGRW
jgi:GNAT superfamily N-acetyltransferase